MIASGESPMKLYNAEGSAQITTHGTLSERPLKGFKWIDARNSPSTSMDMGLEDFLDITAAIGIG